MDSTIFLASPNKVSDHLKDGFPLTLVSDKLIRELLSLIDLIIVDGHRHNGHIFDHVLISDEPFEQMFEYELLWLDNFARPLTLPLNLVAHHVFLFHYPSKEFF